MKIQHIYIHNGKIRERESLYEKKSLGFGPFPFSQ